MENVDRLLRFLASKNGGFTFRRDDPRTDFPTFGWIERSSAEAHAVGFVLRKAVNSSSRTGFDRIELALTPEGRAHLDALGFSEGPA